MLCWRRSRRADEVLMLRENKSLLAVACPVLLSALFSPSLEGFGEFPLKPGNLAFGAGPSGTTE